MLRKIKHIVEFILVYSLICFSKAMGLDRASAFFGKLAVLVGPRLRVSDVARRNLQRVLPEIGDAAREMVIKEMWENIGRLAGEMPHWNSLSKTQILKRVKMQDPAPMSHGKGIILLSGHYGNWEILPHVLRVLGVMSHIVYRPANNPYVDKLINNMRLSSHTKLISKGAAGMRQIITLLRQDEVIGMLFDQKVSDGVPIPFFGVEAKTITAPGALAARLGSDIAIARIMRTKGAHFQLQVRMLPVTSEMDAVAVMQELNNILESWVRERPEQWFWLHKRW